MHGRLGEPAADPEPAPEIRGRFLEATRVYYPGVELVADTRFSPRTDPYLADHHIDGLMVLPLAIALEAMAQAASVLAGRTLRQLAGARMDAPVVLLPGTRRPPCGSVRYAARTAVETVLRCADSGFQVGHFRALFPLQPAAPTAQNSPEPAVAPRSGQTARLGLTVASAGGIVDGTDLYGPVFFQAGAFRRVAFLPELTSRSCSALVRGADDRPWFRRPTAEPERRQRGGQRGRARRARDGRAAGAGQPGAKRRRHAHAAGLRPRTAGCSRPGSTR